MIEYSILVVLIFAFIWTRLTSWTRWSMALFLVVTFIFHLVERGLRWQMMGAYLLILVLLIDLISSKKDKKYSLGSNLAWVFVVLVTLLLVLVFPYNKMPDYTGGQVVGTISFDLVDLDRMEIYGERKGQNRKIRVQLWYPAEESEGLAKAKWLNDGTAVAESIPDFVGLPSFLLRYAARIDSNSYLHASIEKTKAMYPVVVISHGWMGFRNLHSDLAEALVGQGYVVVAIEHTYGSLATVFDTGQVVNVDPGALPPEESVEDFFSYSNRLVTTYAEDARFVLDTLERLNAGKLEGKKMFSLFEDRLDLEHIGIVGHSTGGGGATKLTMTDPRIKALVGYDPWVEPIKADQLKQGISKPSLFINSQQWKDGPNQTVLKTINQVETTVTRMYRLNGTSHQDFSMMYMFEPVTRLLGFAGELESERSIQIQQEMTIGFLNHHLKGQPAPRQGDQTYEEVVPLFLK